MKLAITDIETTGLDPKKYEIIEIGCVICDSDTFEIIETFDFKIKPLFPELGHPKAYECNGYNEEDWKDGITHTEAMQIYSEKTKDCVFVAQCVTFDYPFIEALSLDTGIKLQLNRYKFDIPSISWFKCKKDLKKYSLKSMCEFLGIEPEPEIHRGINGAMKSYEVLKTLSII
jgi:DNA polymerase III epsilon subunit-like protein